MSERQLVDPAVLDQIRGWRPYVEAKLGFRNHWYPARLAQDVKEGEPVEVKLLGESILVNRIDGALHAIKNRCLHRGVAFTRRIECFTKGTITCWYHGWTYRWDSGELCDIITNPQSAQIGRHNLKTYPVCEAKGLVFIFIGEMDPPPLECDVPPEFLDSDMAIHGKIRTVKSNWRVGVENGFDSGHIWIHKDSKLVTGNDLALPLGFAPIEAGASTRNVEEDGGPKGVYDLLGDASIPVFEGYLGDQKVAEGHYGSKRVANNISIWLPGVLKVDPWPQEGMIQFEWYVPADENTHYYIQTLGRRVADDAEAKVFEKEFVERWVDLALDGFNDDDVWAREAVEAFYADDSGWVEEILYESDLAIVEWRKLASRHNRGIQQLSHL